MEMSTLQTAVNHGTMEIHLTTNATIANGNSYKSFRAVKEGLDISTVNWDNLSTDFS